MAKRNDIKSILIIGAGPIVIGQACEFDYSGTQACKALKQEGYRVILINSNPATIMTDPNFADSIYIEPIKWPVVAEIIKKEKPDAILPTMGGQTALNCALDLAREGVLAEHNVELIGATKEAIDKAEDRELFRKCMDKLGYRMPRSAIAHSLEEALQVQAQLGYPTIIRPSFTLGGSGGGIAYNKEEFIDICLRGLELSPTNELLLDESIIGWKEFEMEVVRDKNDNCIIVCSIENFDPMGVHTGDSITVAPAQSLTDKEYQQMRTMSLNILREIGVDTGGSNVQFGMNPKTGEIVVIEMNPRVSRSSALASKATGFPIAKVAAKLAVGYTLDELRNEITGNLIPASFEPSIDYVVTKIPRFNFEKFPGTEARLSTQMRSVGEVMAMGRTFQESLQKAIRGLEISQDGLCSVFTPDNDEQMAQLKHECRIPGPNRLWYVADAMRAGLSVDELYALCHIDPWFLAQLEELIQAEQQITSLQLSDLNQQTLMCFKQMGFADSRIAHLMQVEESLIRGHRHALSIHPVYKRVDSCAAEFKSSTAYLYSTYETYCESHPSDKEKIMVLGGGPNRIGQGIEFDYCCVHAAMALKECGYETIMVNCNPETVSTDYDTADRLYFEPLTLEDVLEIVHVEQPKGVIIHYGGQTPLKLARALEAANVPIVGTPPDAIDRAEDRERFRQLLQQLQLKQPPNGTVTKTDEALVLANELSYPILVRPSYVLGGRAMEIVYNDEELTHYMQRATHVSPASPLLLDRFLEDAIEIDVDAICDGEQVLIAGVMQHIEQAGVHSGDSSCCLPPFNLSDELQAELQDQVTRLALELGVIGLMNTQFAIQNNTIYLLEVNPRASRTVPFVSKATGVDVAKVAARCKVGQSLASQGVEQVSVDGYFFVKSPVFPFEKFQGADPILGPEMKSTGEIMGIGKSFAEAYAKSALASSFAIDKKKKAFVSIRHADKTKIEPLAVAIKALGFDIIATDGTAKAIRESGIECENVNKVAQGQPHIVDMIKNDEVGFIVNTTEGKQAIADSFTIRRSALQHKVYYTTTLAGGMAAVTALQAEQEYGVIRLQDLHQ